MILRLLRLYALLLVLPPAQALAADRQQEPADEAAQAPAVTNRQLALQKAHEGLDLYRAGRWQDAYDRFQEADRLHHAPTLTVYLARCKHKLGRLAEAHDLYQRILAEPPGKDDPALYAEVRREAERELAQVQAELSTQPGPEPPQRPPPYAAPLSGSTPPSRTVAPQRAHGSLLPAGLAFGFGGASLGVGAITGIMAIHEVTELESSCPEHHCHPSFEGDVERAALLGNVSTAAFIVGGAAAAAGVVLLIVRPGEGAAQTPRRCAARTDWDVRWNVGVGVGQLDIRAEF